MLVYIKEEERIYFIDYRSRSPLNSNLENIFDLINYSNKPLETVPIDFDYEKFDIVDVGYKASAVPGTVAGLLDVHARFGKLELKEVLAPAIKQASDGVIVS